MKLFYSLSGIFMFVLGMLVVFNAYTPSRTSIAVAAFFAYSLALFNSADLVDINRAARRVQQALRSARAAQKTRKL